MKYIVSGGGTGGHIFPAISIAKALQRLDPEASILFVGAEDRMEMERVPAAGFEIVGLPVAGFNRSNLLKNFKVLLKLRQSLRKAAKVVKDFQPDIAIGVGGYASGPTLKQAQKKGIPTLVQEQNSYAGVTNKLLAKKADKICVAYDGMEKFFPPEKIVMTGNPLRPSITRSLSISKKDAKRQLGFPEDLKLIVAVGGSLGARTVNEAVKASLPVIEEEKVSLLWQTGKRFFDDYKDFTDSKKDIQVVPFLDNMDLAYAAADLIVSRAGASTISELQFLGKASVLIPSPNVAEDHQRKNAEALSNVGAAVTVLDAEAVEKLPSILRALLNDSSHLEAISARAKKMGLPGADEKIARIAMELAKTAKSNG